MATLRWATISHNGQVCSVTGTVNDANGKLTDVTVDNQISGVVVRARVLFVSGQERNEVVPVGVTAVPRGMVGPVRHVSLSLAREG